MYGKRLLRRGSSAGVSPSHAVIRLNHEPCPPTPEPLLPAFFLHRCVNPLVCGLPGVGLL